MRVLYFLERYQEARASGEAVAKTILDLLPGQVLIAEHCFYYTLVLTALYNDLPEAEQPSVKQILLRNQEQMKRWSEDCPHNFLYKYDLMSAEIARLEGKDNLAWDLYDQGIQAAHDCLFVHHEALGNELAGQFYLAKGKNKIAKAYLQDARLGYLKWGAATKIKLLDEQYRSLLAISHNSGRIVIENAGAQRGVFVLHKNAEWMIEAEATLGTPTFIQSVSLEQSQLLPISVINYVKHTRNPLVLHSAYSEETFKTDPYVV